MPDDVTNEIVIGWARLTPRMATCSTATPARWSRPGRCASSRWSHDTDLDHVLELKVPDEVVQRLLKRAEIEGRPDDTEEVIRERMKVYHAETTPISDMARGRGLLRGDRRDRLHGRGVPAVHGRARAAHLDAAAAGPPTASA